MPRVIRIGPYRFFFYSNEGVEPPHIHVEREERLAKFWLKPVALARSGRFNAHELRKIERLIVTNQERFWRLGVRTSAAEVTARALDVRVTADELIVDLADGRSISVPLAWFPRLLHATPAQRKRWRFIGDGEGIHWPAIDEDLSVAGLLRGTPAPPQVFDRRDRS